MDLLISYSWNRFTPARREVTRILSQFGDERPRIERTSVNGIAIAYTVLDSRDVVKKCRELFGKAPAFRFAIKWVPVDYWCATDLEAMKKVIDEHVRDQIGENETWGMKVEKRRWQQYHKKEIIEYLARSIDRKVDLDNPDKIVRIDVIGRRTAISLLRPEEIFSINVGT